MPYSRQITSMLPQLWQESEGQHMFRSSIFLILGSLVVASREESLHLHEFVVPLIRSSVDMQQVCFSSFHCYNSTINTFNLLC